MEALEVRMGELQRQCKELKIPVMIVFEGVDVAGKGLQMGKLMKSMDPRGFQVYPMKAESEEEYMRPFLWRYWTKTPEKGRIAIFDHSWYQNVTIDIFDAKHVNLDVPEKYEEIRCFEKQLADDGTCIIKLFLYIDKIEQKKRMDKLLEDKSTAWRVKKEDLKRNKKFDLYVDLIEDVLKATDTEYAPWHMIESVDKRFATVKMYKMIITQLEHAVREKHKENTVKQYAREKESKSFVSKNPVLAEVDLSKKLGVEEYQKKLDKLQKKIEKLHGELYRKRIPVVIGFEGWDAGGKGGAIKRLTQKMDPRGYVVHPVASPTPIENAHHYLWRFWIHAPKAGHVAVFDRTWYGRVMVERIEGFCTKKEWNRAYKEINDMEASFVNAGAIVLKFWMHIDKDEQERRFTDRQNTPEKVWKITDEDWRNREKWDQYEEVVNEMIEKTSTPNAPWIIVEGNDKLYARIKVLETVIKAMEERLK